MDNNDQPHSVDIETAHYMSPTVIRNGLIFGLCVYGVLGVIVGLIWG